MGLGWPGALVMALSFRARVVYRFRYVSGGVAFDVWKSGPQKHQAEAFADAVVGAIRACSLPMHSTDESVKDV